MNAFCVCARLLCVLERIFTGTPNGIFSTEEWVFNFSAHNTKHDIIDVNLTNIAMQVDTINHEWFDGALSL
jgi:hypothetical protein